MQVVNVLVVDDEPTIRNMLRMMLPKEYNTVFAADGEEALHSFQTHPIDLVILDIMMPKRDGISVCKALREYSNVPVIMCSARSRQEDFQQATDAGANAYLTKPFSIQNLRKCIHHFVPN